MQYIRLCIDFNLLPTEGRGIHLWIKTTDRRMIIFTCDPLLLATYRGRGFNEVCKGIDGFINLSVQWQMKTCL